MKSGIPLGKRSIDTHACSRTFSMIQLIVTHTRVNFLCLHPRGLLSADYYASTHRVSKPGTKSDIKRVHVSKFSGLLKSLLLPLPSDHKVIFFSWVDETMICICASTEKCSLEIWGRSLCYWNFQLSHLLYWLSKARKWRDASRSS